MTWCCTATPSNQCPYQVSTSYALRFAKYNLAKNFKVKVTMAGSKVKSRSHHGIAYLHPLINVLTKYQSSIPYCFLAQARIKRSRSL